MYAINTLTNDEKNALKFDKLHTINYILIVGLMKMQVDINQQQEPPLGWFLLSRERRMYEPQNHKKIIA